MMNLVPELENFLKTVLDALKGGLGHILEHIFQEIALVLSILNGYILVTNWFKDKPHLIVSPIHPEIYQWWFRMPDTQSPQGTIRHFGFLLYTGIANKGLKNVSVNRFRLYVKSQNGKQHELLASNIPEPTFMLNGGLKVLSVFGQKSNNYDGIMHVVSGDSISGSAFYQFSVWGDSVWDPVIKNGEITAKFQIYDVFDHKSQCPITFREKPFDYICNVLPGWYAVEEEK